MSLILDALKRAESERGAQAIAALPEISPVPSADPDFSLRWILLATVALAVAGFAGWRYFSPAKKSAPVVQTPARAVSAPRSEPLSSARPITGTESITSFDEVTGPEEPQQLESQVATPAPAPASIPAPVPEPTPTVEPAAVAVVAQSPKPVRRSPVRLNDTSPEYRAAFPVIVVQVHSWDASPAARFVRIDGSRFVEGDTLPSGPGLVSITADGLILDWNGERVIYPLN